MTTVYDFEKYKKEGKISKLNEDKENNIDIDIESIRKEYTLLER